MQDETQLPEMASARSVVKINLIFIVSPGFLVTELTLFSGRFKLAASHNQVTERRSLEGSYHDSQVVNGRSST